MCLYCDSFAVDLFCLRANSQKDFLAIDVLYASVSAYDRSLGPSARFWDPLKGDAHDEDARCIHIVTEIVLLMLRRIFSFV
jgi:hypothetical protein